MAQTIKQLHQGYRFLNPHAGLGSKPNVYRRSLEARNNTNAYLAAMERKAAGVDESIEEQDRTHRMQVYKALLIGLAVLVLVAVAVGMVML